MYDTLPLLRASVPCYGCTAGQGSSCGGTLHDSLLELAR
ncbi:MAG TPA: DUF3641 domain-containing protein [Gammaproteobacteria bacterium]|jgi:hypothetical protein